MEETPATRRGDRRGFLISMIVVSVSISLLLLLFQAFDPMLTEIWGSRSGWYIDKYRTWGAKVWRLFYRSSSTWLCLWLPVLWLLSAFLIQSGLRKKTAKRFNTAHSVFFAAMSVLAFFCFFGVLLRPLI